MSRLIVIDADRLERQLELYKYECKQDKNAIKHINHFKKMINKMSTQYEEHDSWDPGRPLTVDEAYYFYK